ncbi:MAG: diguanylate cyclase [Arcobacteraceae bacterium]
MIKKSIILIIFLLLQTLSAQDLKKVTIQLSWFDQFQFAGYYIAKEKGYYKDLGLDVEIKPFKFGLDIPQDISTGKSDFAVGRETLILDKANGKNIVALYALFQASPLILMSTQESKISKISDFTNKRIMTTIDDASEVSLKSMLTSSKINFDNLKFLKHTHNIEDLITKKTDIISAYISKSPYTLHKMGIKYNIFSPKDYGFDMYSDFLYTNNNLITNDLQTAVNFKDASLKGWEYAYNNIEETSKLIYAKYNTQKLSLDEIIYEATELKKLSYLNTSELGNINLNKIQRIHDLYNLMGLLPNKIDIHTFVYNKNDFYSRLTLEEKQFIKENPIITIGEQEMFKPINFINTIGMHEGLVHDYLDIISEKTSLRFVSQIDDQSNLLTKLLNKNVDMLAVSPDIDKSNLLFTTKYFNLHQTSFTIKDKQLNTIHKIGILNYVSDNKKIQYIQQAYPKAEIVSFSDIQSAEKSLKNRSVDLLYVSEEVLLTYIKDNHINYIEYANSKITTNNLPLFFSLNQDSKILNSILSKAIKDISYEQHNSIRNKWIPVIIENEFDWALVWEIVAIVTIIIILVLYRQISMNKLNNELQEVNNKLKELSERDHLTKLYNRRYFEDYIEKIILQDTRDNSNTALLMFDIDDFKKINDTYGHHIGDEVLRQLAKNIQESSRKSDIIARIGGEEFLILLQNTNLKGAEIHCEKIRKMIENLIIQDGKEKISFTVSMGLTSFRKNDTLDSVLLRIDNSLYEAKSSGKNKLLVN